MLSKRGEILGTLFQELGGRGVEALGPVEAACRSAPVKESQIVHHIAAGDDHDVVREQTREACAEVDVILDRFARIDRELDHRHVRVREDMCKHRPGAVIKAPAVNVLANQDWLCDLRNFVGKFRGAGRRIVKVEERLRKAVEVVDYSRSPYRGDGRDIDMPVGRDGKNSSGPTGALAD